jgi:predicted XRE-type DNA-binding protein
MSKNVFADLEVPNAETHLVKAGLVLNLSRLIRSKGTTQTEIATIAGWSQARVSQIMRGQFHGISVEKLIAVTNALNHNVRIVIAKMPVKEGQGRTTVVTDNAGVKRRPGRLRRDWQNWLDYKSGSFDKPSTHDKRAGKYASSRKPAVISPI